MKIREHRPGHDPSPQTATHRAGKVTPGKRTLTMGLASPRAAGAGPLQRRAVTPQGNPAPSRAAEGPVEDWTAVALRPDLHQTPIMRKSASEIGYAGADTPHAPASGGAPMPAALQARMNAAFGADFSAVRIHEGPAAQAMGALAYTQGTSIHFAPGQYAPDSQRGQELLGHELAHVVQQAQGRVHTTMQAKGLPINDDPALEREADEMGARAARAEPMSDAARDPVPSVAGVVGANVVQRAIPAHATSEQGLKQLYDALCQQVGSIGALTDQIGQPVRIRYGNDDETGGRKACFLVDSLTIVISESLRDGDPAEIRHYILIELNHARLGNAPQPAPQPDDADERDADELAAYTTALDALRVEYHEWISAYLTHMETQDANLSMTHGDNDPDVVTPRLAAAYTTPGQGFFEFDIYIQMQVNMRHTANYDPAAVNDQWVGFELVELAQQYDPNLVSISEDEHQQNSLLLITNPGALQALLAARVNPFAGAQGTQLLSDKVSFND